MKTINKIREDLAWRGPTGRPMRYVLLEREMAQEVLSRLELLRTLEKTLTIDIQQGALTLTPSKGVEIEWRPDGTMKLGV